MHEVTTVLILMCIVTLLGTLVVQGLTLPWLVRQLKLSGSGPSTSQQEMDARLALLASANMYLDDRKSQGFPIA